VHLQTSDARISGALTHTEVSLRVNHFAMVQLGLYAARYSEGLQHLVQLPARPERPRLQLPVCLLIELQSY
jgi:hypothetical protein